MDGVQDTLGSKDLNTFIIPKITVKSWGQFGKALHQCPSSHKINPQIVLLGLAYAESLYKGNTRP